MKKLSVILLAAALLCTAGCGQKPPAETQPVETEPVPQTQETVPVPELTYGTAQINGLPAILSVLSRGDHVEIVKRYDETHYAVKTDFGYGLVEKNLIRLNGEPEYEPWTGYTYHNAELYDNFRLAGAPVKSLSSGTKVEVLEDLGWCCLVAYEDMTGYVVPEKLYKNAGFNDEKKGSSGSEESQETPPTEETTPVGGEDGGEIYLQFQGGVTLLGVFAPQEGNVTGQATILADGTEVMAGYFDRGDAVPIVAESGFAEKLEGYHGVYLQGMYAYVSKAYVRMDGEAPYEAWDGYSSFNAALYEDHWMLDSPIDRLNANTALRVVYELENCYLVEAGNTVGYIAKDEVMLPPVHSGGPNSGPGTSGNAPSGETGGVEESEPTEADPTQPPGSGNAGEAPTQPPVSENPGESPTQPPSGGNSGESNSGNSNPEWTPPVL